jgi:hypothetical protein
VTLEQFLGGVLGLALIAIARLVDRWLPPTDPPHSAAEAPRQSPEPCGGATLGTETPETSTTSTALPSAGDLDVIE